MATIVNPELTDKLTLIFDDGFTKRELEVSIKKSVIAFVKANRALCLKYGVLENDLDLAGDKKVLPKSVLIRLVIIPFYNKELFHAFLKDQPKEFNQILEALMWREYINGEEIESKMGIQLFDERAHHYYPSRTVFELINRYTFFKVTSNDRYGYSSAYSKPNVFLQFPLAFREHVRAFFPIPKEATIHPLKEIEATDFIYETEETILLEIPRILAYYEQKQIRTANSGRPLASTYGKMQRKLNLREFYPKTKQKELKNLRTGLLAGLVTTKTSNVSNDEPHEQVKSLLDNYQEVFESIYGVVTHVKGIRDGYYTIPQMEPEMFNIFKSLPVNEWIAISNLESYIQMNGFDVKPISYHHASAKGYYIDKSKANYEQKTYIGKGIYNKFILCPLIKGTAFLFAAFGMLDLAYNVINMEEFPKAVQSNYDGLVYFRVNNLGAYLFGHVNEYKLPEKITTSSIRLSKDSLTIIIDEKDTNAVTMLEPYTERVSPNRFRTDYPFFLKDVKSKKDLESKIKLFQQSVKVDLPPNWKTFIADLRQKLNPLNPKNKLKVFEVPSTNKELLRLIAKDHILQKLCFKAEGYHILIKDTNYNKFKKRLQQFGYLMT